MTSPRLTSRQVFDEHGRYAFRVLRHFGVRDADLEDVCQEVFVTVHRKLESFEGRSSVRTWLYRICQNAASDHLRRAHVQREIAVDVTAPENAHLAGSDPGEPNIEARSMVEFLLGRLDEQKRHVFVLYEIEGLTMKEVCEVLNCPLQTAYSRLHAARALLTEALTHDAKEPTS